MGTTCAAIFDHTEALGVRDWVRLDLSIVRGLAYYTGIVFELFDAKGELRAICGGGRYDTLLESLGGVSLPALGFGMGDVVLGELLRDRAARCRTTPAVDVWVAYGDAEPSTDAMGVAATAARARTQRRVRARQAEARAPAEGGARGWRARRRS